MAANRESTAHVFFDNIKNHSDPVAAIRDLFNPASPTFEHDHLDFKTSVDQSTGSPLTPEKIKEMWSEALGGFANSGGGAIVWGVDCRKDSDDVDAAQNEVLVPDVLAFQTNLTEWARNANDPPIPDVEFAPFKANGNDGFLLCLIPQSRHLPHNSEFVKNKPYIMRNGDSFIKIPPALLRRMFYPQFTAVLEFAGQASIILANASQDHLRISMDLLIENVGTGTAKDVFVVVRDKSIDPARQATGNGIIGTAWALSPPAVGGGHGFLGRSHLHPKMQSNIYQFFWYKSRPSTSFTVIYDVNVMNITFPPLILEIEAYAENMAPQYSRLKLTDAQIIGKVLVRGERIPAPE